MAIQITTNLTTTRKRRGDNILDRVEELIRLHNAGYSEYVSMVHACDLFFTLDYWLKWYPTVATYEKEQAGAVQELYGTVVRLLCMAFKTTVNVLPRELEAMFGRELTADGVDVDVTQRFARFAEKGETKKYQLIFKNGKVYQFAWWEQNYVDGAMVLCESMRAQPDVPLHGAGLGGDFPNWGYCVMSMNRDVYMAKHQAPAVAMEYKKEGADILQKVKNVPTPGIYHSFYLPGIAAMFAGSMLIINGELCAVSPNSGHFKPSENNTLALLQALLMFQIPLEHVAVYNHLGRYVCHASDFIAANGNWANLRANQKGSQAANEKAWSERQHPKVRDWVLCRTPVPYGAYVQGADSGVLPPNPPVQASVPGPYAVQIPVQSSEDGTDYNIVTVDLDLNDASPPPEEAPYN